MTATARWSEAERLRLAHAVRDRRVALRLSKDEAARRGQTTNTTWTKVEAAQSVRDTTYAIVEDVLGWDPGTCRRILSGMDEPSASERSNGPERVAALPEVEIWRPVPREELRSAVQTAAIAVVPEATGAQIQELQKRIEEELLRRMERRKDSE